MIRRPDDDSATFRERLKEADAFFMGTGQVAQTVETLAADLDRERIDYALVGGMALNAHGYQRETVDVDALLRPEGLVAFTQRLVGLGYVPKFPAARKTFRCTKTGVAVEFLTTGDYPGDGKPKPVAFPDPASVAEEIEGVKVVDLPTLVALKLASGMTAPHRRRDLADVQDLIRILRLPLAFADRLDPYVREMFGTLYGELDDAGPHDEEPQS